MGDHLAVSVITAAPGLASPEEAVADTSQSGSLFRGWPAYAYQQTPAYWPQAPTAASHASLFHHQAAAAYHHALPPTPEEPESGLAHSGFGQVLSPLVDAYHHRPAQFQHQNPFAPAMPSSTSSVGSPYSVGSGYTSHLGKRKAGGRRPKEEEEQHLSKDEMEKRKVRRQRNKEAAARCRQRRLDQMEELQRQVADLDKEILERDNQIEALRHEKAELETHLRIHNQTCPNGSKLIRKYSATQPPHPMAPISTHSVLSQAPPNMSSQAGTVVRDIKTEPTLTQVVTAATDTLPSESIPRPDTLGLDFNPAGSGLSMNTPSAGLMPGSNFDLMGMPTGLTPMTTQALTGFTPGSTALSAPSALDTPSVDMQRL